MHPTTHAQPPANIMSMVFGRPDPDEHLADQAARERALCATDSIADFLSEQCCTAPAYDGGRSAQHYHDELALIRDYAAAAAISTPNLLALAMGVASHPQARIAAMNELAQRATAERQPRADVTRALGAMFAGSTPDDIPSLKGGAA